MAFMSAIRATGPCQERELVRLGPWNSWLLREVPLKLEIHNQRTLIRVIHPMVWNVLYFAITAIQLAWRYVFSICIFDDIDNRICILHSCEADLWLTVQQCIDCLASWCCHPWKVSRGSNGFPAAKMFSWSTETSCPLLTAQFLLVIFH